MQTPVKEIWKVGAYGVKCEKDKVEERNSRRESLRTRRRSGVCFETTVQSRLGHVLTSTRARSSVVTQSVVTRVNDLTTDYVGVL